MKYILINFLFFTTLITNEVYAQIPAGYYDGTSGLTGEQLKSKLHTIIRNHTVKTYSEVKDVLRDVDEDPNNSSNVILIYTRRSISKSDFASNNEPDFWNREHTWPKSHGFPSEQDTAYTDTHALRPCDATVNSSRSNKDFNNVDNITSNEQGEAANTYTTDDFWEPTDEVKGDLARTMFYMATRYNSESLDLELVDRISISGDPELGVFYTLLQWHENDPVSQEEIDRNDGIYGYQGNRNPYIDNPSWIADIWGTSTDPLLSINQEAFNTNFGTVAAGSSLVQQYTLKAYNLTNDVDVVVNSPFSISLDNSLWNQSLTISKGNTSPLETVIYIRFSPAVEDGSTYESTVTHSSTGATNALFTVYGTEGSIQQITLAEARQKPLGDVVSVSGVVISKGNNSSNSRVIFDGSAGIVVRSFDAGNESAPLNYGDSILVSGGLSEYNNLLQIENSPIVITLLKQNAIIPEPQLITLDQINESFESELVTVENVEFTNSGGFVGGGSAGNFTISDGVNNM
ncbi:MAG: endonuclease, partial [Cyclobacteriaceae bacterium]|nr:endonuclease [Cyclobacteriaceae bacterium]